MINRGMDNSKQVLQGLIDKANERISEIKIGKRRLYNLTLMQNILLNLKLT